MPLLTDTDQIRAALRTDPVWSVYALGDLTPGLFEQCRWYTPDLTLVFHGFDTSILFALGTRSIREALGDLTWPAHLQLQDDGFAEACRYVTIGKLRRMWRMGWSRRLPATARRPGAPVAARLQAHDVPALERLYADGAASGEAPDFFFPSMVADGVFCGVWEGDEMVAVAGTHLVAREEGAAAIGNVYTRRDRRGRGLGRVTTTAVLDALDGVETVGLNVLEGNEPAIALYESLGFVRNCLFNEALATGPRPA